MIIVNQEGLGPVQLAFVAHPWSEEGALRIAYMMTFGMLRENAEAAEAEHWRAMERMCADMVEPDAALCDIADALQG